MIWINTIIIFVPTTYYSNNRTERDFRKAIAANDSLIKFAETLAPQNLPGLYNINSMTYEATKTIRML